MDATAELLTAGPLQLRDGRRVWFRPIEPADAARLRRFHRRLSAESQRLRFFAPMRELSARMAEQFANVDFETRGAVVICHPGEDEIRGVGRYEPNGDGSMEVAFVLEDRLQGLGIGKALLHLLATYLRERGVTRLTAMVLPENRAMLAVFRSCDFPVSVVRRDGIDFVTIDITHSCSRTLVAC